MKGKKDKPKMFYEIENFVFQEEEFRKVRFYGLSNEKVYAIYSKNKIFVLVDCFDLSYEYIEDSLFKTENGKRIQVQNIKGLLQLYVRNILPLVKTTNTFEEAEEALNAL